LPLLSLPLRSSEFYPAALHSPTDSESDFCSPVLIGLYRRNDINGECYVEGKLHDATENNPQSKTAFSRLPPVHTTNLEGQKFDDLAIEWWGKAGG
jgi:hypothetical protein